MKLTKRLPFSQAAHWPEMVKSALREAYAHKKDIIVTIKPDEETRSSRQNRLLWLWNGEFAKHIEASQGQIYDTDEIHEFIVGKLLPRKAVTMPDGEPVITRASTRKLSVKDFADFLNRYEMLCADSYGLILTRPDDLYIQALMRDGDG